MWMISYTHPIPCGFHTPTLSLRSLSSAAAAAAVVGAADGGGNNYNHLIQTLCNRGHLDRAVHLLSHEPHPTQRTYELLILACTRSSSPYAASAVHRHLTLSGSARDPFLATKLIDMYSHLHSLHDARDVFDKTPHKTIFLHNALLRALALAGHADDALALFQSMAQAGTSPDSFSYSYALKSCLAHSSPPGPLASGRVRELHAHIVRRGFHSSVHVATTLVDSYGKLGWLTYSRRVFDCMSSRNVVSWSAMIACYAKNESPFEAIGLFREMMEKDAEQVPNSITVISVLQACAGLAALGQGRLVHAYVLRRGLDCVVSVANALIAMYVKCGKLETGRRLFEGLGGRKDVVSWNSMISGYGIHGLGSEAIRVFEEMISAGISPSPVTFVTLLGSCSHVGLVEEGKRLFQSMAQEYGVIPGAEHYACMVDLLGRAGHLEEAAKIVEGMRIEPGPTVWGSLLGACRIHTHVELAERACARLFELEPANAGNYVLLADIYAEAKLWDEMNRVKKLVEARGLQKVPGCSWIEVKKKVYSFMSIDEMNPQIEQLHAFLVQLVKEMKGIGYVPNTKVVLYDLEQEEKERIILGHSEKLALAFGLINSGNGEVIRITKNLRLCEDCHSITKFISKFARREILVRDVNRFHHFKDGVCSCCDYW